MSDDTEAISDRDLERLFERLMSPERFPEGTTPTEQQLVAHLAGEDDSETRRWLEERLSAEPECRDDLARLQEGLEWFESQQKALLEAVIARVTGESPSTVERGRRIVDLRERGARLADNARDTLAEVLEGIRAMAGGLAYPRLSPEFRGIGTGTEEPSETGVVGRPISSLTVQAELVDHRDRPVFDDAGSPVTVGFAVLRGEIDDHGRLALDLSALDLGPIRESEGRLELQVDLFFGEDSILLPRVKVLQDGRAAIAIHLPTSIAIERLPLSALRACLVRTSGES